MRKKCHYFQSFLFLFIIFISKIFGSVEIWSSGVIERRPANADENGQESPKSPMSILGSFFQPFFGTDSTPSDSVNERDNFVQADLPISLTEIRKILFVTPGIVKRNPKGVKETFARLYCNLLGILLRDREILRFLRGKFFALSPRESKEMLISCLKGFEDAMEMRLQVAMIDTGPGVLSYTLLQEFNDREILLFRHPLNMLTNEIYYEKPLILKKRSETGNYSWYEELKSDFKFSFSKPKTFRIFRRYFPVEFTMNQREKQEVVKDSEAEKEIIEKLENIYGPFDEISLSSSSPKVKEDCGEFSGEFGGEFIESEGCCRECENNETGKQCERCYQFRKQKLIVDDTNLELENCNDIQNPEQLPPSLKTNFELENIEDEYEIIETGHFIS